MTWAPPPVSVARLTEAVRQMDTLIAALGQPTEFVYVARRGAGVMEEVTYEQAIVAAKHGVTVELRLRIPGAREAEYAAHELELRAERERRRNLPREIVAGIPHAGQYIGAGELP